MLRRNIGKIVVGGLLSLMLTASFAGTIVLLSLPVQPAQAAGVLTKTVTKIFPTANEVGFRLILKDDDRPDLADPNGVVIDKVYKANVPPGDMANTVRDELGAQAQRDIDAYKALRARYDSAAYDIKVAQIDGALTL